jgi:hypothetical protein
MNGVDGSGQVAPGSCAYNNEGQTARSREFELDATQSDADMDAHTFDALV